jgi:hypothetical protein
MKMDNRKKKLKVLLKNGVRHQWVIVMKRAMMTQKIWELKMEEVAQMNKIMFRLMKLHWKCKIKNLIMGLCQISLKLLMIQTQSNKKKMKNKS